MEEKINIYQYQRIKTKSAKGVTYEPLRKKVNTFSLHDEHQENPEHNDRKIRKHFELNFKVPKLVLSRENIKTWLSAESIFLFFICILLNRAKLLGGVMPFSTAFFAALITNNKKYIFPMLVAGILGQLFIQDKMLMGINIAIYIFLASWQVLLPISFVKRWVYVPLIVFTSIILIKGLSLYLKFSATFSFLNIMMEAILAAGLVIIYFSFLNIIKAKRIPQGLNIEEAICLIIVTLGLIAGLSGIEIFNLSLASLLSRYLILIAAYIQGVGIGAALGAIVGLLPSLIQINAPVLVGIYAFSGMLAGAMNIWKKIGVSLGFILGNLLLSYYLLDYSTIFASLVESSVAILIFWVTPSKILNRLKTASTNVNSIVSSDYVRYADFVKKKVLNLSKSLEELSFNFGQTASSSQLQSKEQISKFLNLIATNTCAKCSLYKTCWERDFSNTGRYLLMAFEAVDKYGSIRINHLPEHFSKRCIRAQELVIALNCLYESFRIEKHWLQKMDESQELLNSNLKGLAQVLEEIASEIESEGYFFEELELNIADTLLKAGYNLNEIKVWQKNENNNLEVSIYLGGCNGTSPCRKKILPILEDIMGHPIVLEQALCANEVGNECCELKYLPAPGVKIEVGYAQEAKDIAEVCGDNCSMFPLPDGKYAVILSDGMGVGSKACEQSTLALSLLEQLLKAGFKHYLAVKMLNSLLLLRAKEETFATIDLAIIDRYTGSTEFLKIGSAPSYVLRKNEFWSIDNNSIPAGIISNLSLEPIHQQLLPGDILIMMTDGIMETEYSSHAQEDLLKNLFKQGICQETSQNIADYILENAKLKLRSGKLKDDLSIVVVKLDWENA